MSLFTKFDYSLLLGYAHNLRIGVAVSGGLDSMCLLHILQQYQKFDLHVLTVDHNLRETSKRDVEFVRNYSVDHALQYQMFEWSHDGVDSNIQSNARHARYDFMTDYARHHYLDFIVTAHHANDQIENFFIKLLRGSSIYSFASNDILNYKGVKILRPLLSIMRKELEEYAQINSITYLEDETNQDTKYFRNELRQKLPFLYQNSQHLDEELFERRILSSIKNLTRASRSLEQLIEECLNQSFCFSEQNGGFYTLDIDKYQEFLPEEQMQSLTKALQKISGNVNTIRIKSIERLYHGLLHDQKLVMTLHGCIIKKYHDRHHNRHLARILKEYR